ncbi:MAG: histidine kinase [Halothiobacillus sp. 14-56-357]|jgi:two-component system sensor histidine kinase KdpD|uniref:sensor histidine kinase n=1 Tax=Halothiobacillus sp. 15-55-196 TaxID=1970382 RepID=UPI000BD5CE7A|nr:sensor histidine kinase KdpD [Halothiobacillus sp. 15-55-196]OZB36932.1 MAG: histidine kinase [Halothiobacillus sp. 15-55-196]OZB56593.1 MAG: histidine kinase [Halothiobacillus sp. 14-56-357]OZB78483.1 MAG: histidine kinase [Halothiobacillus sp. 13-55-115]
MPDKADALLGELKRQSAGRLTVFLGAAPGVGKTYAMLARARELHRQGVDVVIGVIETHGRKETLALVEGLPQVARKKIPYRGHTLEEMDLDALLVRKPTIALVDELAHRNAPGSRHERRWQDVEELLDAGIDVYTTVNIQHLESLNDVVQQITGIRVSETVPDKIFDRLRDIRLIDLPARELIERLKEGKVYLPEQAARAMQAFFSPSNLTALRELAIQAVAEHVDIDLREARAARGMESLKIRRHILVAIDGRGESEYLVRVGARMSERRGWPWSVVTVDSGDSSEALQQEGDQTGHPVSLGKKRAQAEQQRLLEIDRAFALARSLGGETEVLHNTDVAQALLDAAEARGARSIVIGRTRERPIARMFNRTLTQQLLLRGARYELTIVSTPQARRQTRDWINAASSSMTKREVWLILLASAAAIGFAALAERILGLQDPSLIFLLAVVLVASRTRMTSAVITAVLCFLAYDFFFIEPEFTLLINASRGVATAMLFLAAALIAGRLASQLRRQVVALRAANTHATAMQKLGRQLAKAADLGQVIASGTSILKSTLHAEAWIRINGESGPAAATTSLTDKDLMAADWTQQHGQMSGRYTDTLSSSSWLFLPVRSDKDVIGVVGLRFPSDMDRLSFEQRRLAESMVEDIAQAALRTRLVSQLEEARVTGETERLRSALLSSVSHDLRSPLSSMIGAADSLAQYGKDMGTEDQQSLLETIRIEGERLDRYIQNLLDMTRLGQQGLKLTRDWVGIDELVGSASRRLQRYEPNIRLELDIPPGLPPIHVHPALIEQALFNVMENAAKFSPPGEPIHVNVQRNEDGQLQVDVTDRGPGIPEDERRRIFDMFYSVERGDRGKQGTGLGLTIVQGIVGAHMGSVQALPGREGKGTTIRLTLPWGEYAKQEAKEDDGTTQ